MDSIKAYLPNSKLKKDGTIVGKVENLPPPASQGGNLVYGAVLRLFGYDYYNTGSQYSLELEVKNGELEGRISVLAENGNFDYIILRVRRRHSDVAYLVDSETRSLLRYRIFFEDDRKVLKCGLEGEILELLENILL